MKGEVFVVNCSDMSDYKGHKCAFCVLIVGDDSFRCTSKVDLKPYQGKRVAVELRLRNSDKGIRLQVSKLA